MKSEDAPVIADYSLNLPIYILTNDNTRSAASLFALYAQKYAGAKLIGSGISGNSSPFGTSQKIVLPNLGLPVYISTQYLISNQVEKYQDIQWPSANDTPITLDHYIESDPNDSPVTILKAVFRRNKTLSQSSSIVRGLQ